ncbi:MAG: Dipeptidyl aminopeptidase 4 [bacterium]|nr:Dipeptidyl aminopeptidase 4 [bacterium]
MKITKQAFRKISFFVACTLLLCMHTTPASAQSKKPLTLEDLFASPKFAGKAFQDGQWAEKGPVITFVQPEGDSVTHLMSLDLERNQQTKLLDGAKLYATDVHRLIVIDDYAFSADRSRLLIYTDSAPVWRFPTKGYYYLYDFATQKLTPISSREKGYQLFAKLSANGRHVAFVRDRNLFAVELASMKETQLTFDGAEGKIINGTTDWVYEEEFGLRDGWAWSPDGRHLAFVQFDESKTSDFVMANLQGEWPALKRFRFPRAGEANSEIRVGVIDIATGKPQYFATGNWHEDNEAYEYIPRLGWTPAINGKHYVWMLRMNREQNHVALLHGDPENVQLKTIFDDKENTWVEPFDPFGGNPKLVYLEDGKHVLYQSERDGYNHLYLYNTAGGPARQITRGAWEVAAFHGYDAKNKQFYFTANAESPIEQHLYRLAFDPNKSSNPAPPVKITKEKGTHAINWSNDWRYFIDTYSNRHTPPVTRLHKADGSVIKYLEDNTDLVRTVAEYDFPKTEFLTVPGADGKPLHAYLIKPANFDSSRNYPLLMYTYGGPASQNVTDSWDAFFGFFHAYLVQQHQILVACVDNRGAAGYGKAFESAVHKNMGTVEAQDQIAAAKYFGALPYVDEKRIGIWGWSYGGYNTLMAMTKYDGPQVIKLGMAVAPGGGWEMYDTIYTERYMSTPQKNPEGYKEASPLNFVSRLRHEQELLIVHGDQDDNVHFLSTLHLLTALQKNKKRFQFMLYPGGNHSLQGTGNPFVYLHLFQTLTEFVSEKL